VAYWAQVNALYPLFGSAPPAVVPRAGATLLEPKVEKVLDRFGLSWDRLSGDVEHAVQEVLRARLPGDFPGIFERERALWIASFGRLKEAVGAFDPSLQAAVDTATGKVLHEGASLERKLMQVWKRRQDETVQQIRRAAGHLFPNGALQERTVSVLGYVARYGPDLVSRLGGSVGEPGAHVLVPLGRLDP
jgi:bacillithiol synthase